MWGVEVSVMEVTQIRGGIWVLSSPEGVTVIGYNTMHACQSAHSTRTHSHKHTHIRTCTHRVISLFSGLVHLFRGRETTGILLREMFVPSELVKLRTVPQLSLWSGGYYAPFLEFEKALEFTWDLTVSLANVPHDVVDTEEALKTSPYRRREL